MDKVWLVVLGIFILSLSLRATDLGTGLTNDEILWIERAPSFIDAILSHQWNETYIVPHPGVVTMWLSGIFIKAFPQNDFPSMLSIARAPTVIVSSLSIIFVFYLIKILFNTQIALLSAILIALDPFFLAHSRLIHLDAMLTTLMLLCLLFLMAFLKRPRTLILILAGILLGSAILTKLPAMFLIAFIPIVVLFLSNDKRSIRYILYIYLIAAATFILVWPSMWVSPMDTLLKMIFDQQSGLEIVVKNPHGSGFFRGIIDDGNHGPLFYPVSFLMMATPTTILFLLIFFVFFVKNLYNRGLDNFNKNLIVIILYVFLFVTQMALSLKSFPRYILPIFPMVDIMAAIAMYFLFEKYINKDLVLYSLAFGLIIAQLSLLIPISPYFLSYTNPIAFGGPSHATDMILMGWGEGNDLAAKYLNEKPDAKNLTVAVDYSGFAQYFVGKTIPLDGTLSVIDNADYIVFYISALQRNWNKDLLEYYRNKTPEKIIEWNGIDYCHIYKTGRQ